MKSIFLSVFASIVLAASAAKGAECATNVDCAAGENCVHWFSACTPLEPEANCAEYPINDGLDNNSDGWFDYAFGDELSSPRAPWAMAVKRGKIRTTSTGNRMKLRVYGFKTSGTYSHFHCILDAIDLTLSDVRFQLTPLAKTTVLPTILDVTLPAGSFEDRGNGRYIFRDKVGIDGVQFVKIHRKGPTTTRIKMVAVDVETSGIAHPDYTSLVPIVVTFGPSATTWTVRSWVQRGSKIITVP